MGSGFHRGALSALFAVALGASAAEAPRPALHLSAAGALRPGQRVAVSWPPLPPATDEFELLLRYEAPLVLTVRLTESEEPSLPGLSWRVPDLPAGRARLLLRCGGEEEDEEEWAVSASFHIEVAPVPPRSHAILRGGELWIQEGPPPPETSLVPGCDRAWAAPGGLPAPASGPTGAADLPTPRRADAARSAPPAPSRAPGRPSPCRAPQRRVLRV